MQCACIRLLSTDTPEIQSDVVGAILTEGARRRCRLALTRKSTETNHQRQRAFSNGHWSEESRQVRHSTRNQAGKGNTWTT